MASCCAKSCPTDRTGGFLTSYGTRWSLQQLVRGAAFMLSFFRRGETYYITDAFQSTCARTLSRRVSVISIRIASLIHHISLDISGKIWLAIAGVV